MWLNNSIFLLLFLYISCSEAIKVLVDCTWPCADNTHVCIVTNVTVQCGPQHNSQWILSQPNLSPIFIGETARRNTPCVTSPNPPLPETELEEISNGRQSVIHWPPGNSSNPFDDYLSDCEYNTYCNKDTRICANSMPEDSACESTYQCLNSLQCIENNRCTDTSLDDDEDKAASDHHVNHIHTAIIITVVVVAVLVIISVALFIYFYRKRKLKKISKHVSTNSTIISLPPLRSSNNNNNNNNNNNDNNNNNTNNSNADGFSSSSTALGTTSSSQQHHQYHEQNSPSSSLSSSSSPPPPPPSSSSLSSAVVVEQQQQSGIGMAQRSTETTPSMQQRHLQYQLHRQHASIDIKDTESTSNTIPPPPYTP